MESIRPKLGRMDTRRFKSDIRGRICYLDKLSLFPKGDPIFTYSYIPYGEVRKDEKDLLDNTETIINEMCENLLIE